MVQREYNITYKIVVTYIHKYHDMVMNNSEMLSLGFGENWSLAWEFFGLEKISGSAVLSQSIAP